MFILGHLPQTHEFLKFNFMWLYEASQFRILEISVKMSWLERPPLERMHFNSYGASCWCEGSRLFINDFLRPPNFPSPKLWDSLCEVARRCSLE